MFLNLNNLNEGGSQERCAEFRKRELFEGENPKSTTRNWAAAKCGSQPNLSWQKLRR